MSRDLYKLQRIHRRPHVLSDPFHDNIPAGLRDLLSKADSELSWGDFRILLGPHVPAGTYEEVVYFLPLAIDHMRACRRDALDLSSSVVWFTSKYQDYLAHDKASDMVRAELLSLLREWTSRFRVSHFDRSGCLEKGWVKLQYLDLVEDSETVCQMLCDLTEYAAHAVVADRLILELVDFGDDSVKAAWLLELIRAREDVYRPAPSQRLDLASADHALLSSAKKLVQADSEISGHSPTYWPDTYSRIGLA